MKTWIIKRGEDSYFRGGLGPDVWTFHQKFAWRSYDRGFAKAIADYHPQARVVRLKPRAK